MIINKLYRHYLKKIFLKSWAFWATIALLIIVWFVLPFLIYYRFKNLTVSDLKLMGYTEDAQRIEKEGFKGYAALVYSRKLEENYQNYSDQQAKKRQIEMAKLTSEKLKIMREFNYRTIFYYKLIDFFAYNKQDKKYAEKNAFWKLIHELSLWDLTGLVASFFLTYNILDLLFIQPKKDGEEEIILILTPKIKRSDLFLSKIFAFLNFFSLFNLFSFVLPCAFYYWWVGLNPLWGHFAILTFWITIAGPIFFFFFSLLPYLYLRSYVSSTLGIFFKYILIFFSFIWEFIKWIPNFETWLSCFEKQYFNPIIYTTLSLICGIFFLILYYQKYQKEDLVVR
ncbi:MAG: hypothetical protein MRERC_4c062 [Mycoplasmataceae bacterium RC_NB112A]|nr:MAG: hypothetical protein MRERC_4c062 [Mycoplasmataceae bacterium RC_NB112A]